MSTSLENEDEGKVILLSDIFAILERHKIRMIGVPAVTGGIALVISLFLPPVFTSTTNLLPPQQQNSMVTSVLGQLGGLAGSIGGLKNPNELYVGMLQSRTVADNLIQRFKLKDRYDSRTIDDARTQLHKVTKVSTPKSGLISIEVEDKEPKFAADLANAYADELSSLTQNLAVTEASQRRVFFEKQLKSAKDQLANAEVALKRTQESTGMIQLNGQVQALILSTEKLRGAIAAKEVQVASMRTFASSQNPELLRVLEEIRTLRAQLDRLEKGQFSKGGDMIIPTQKLPEVGVEYVRGLREVKYQEAMFEMLAKQYELARIDEAKESSVIQQLDKAVPAEKKSKPSRVLITLGGVLGGALLVVLLAFGEHLGWLRRINTHRVDPACAR